MSFSEYLARVRVERAKNLLSDASLRVTEIAFRCGFNSISQFNRLFRRHAGCSPTRFRSSM
jgi:AraC-like DNA-binding protein